MHEAFPQHPFSPPSGDRVGVEIEFAGLGVREAALALERRMGGRLVEQDPQAFDLLDSALGALRVELDIRHVHPHPAAGNPLQRLPAPVLTGLGYALAPIVPRELVIGPIARGDIGRVNRAIDALRDAGARGDGATLLGSLGLHFNIEHPDAEARDIIAVFKAFLTLEPELRRVYGAGGPARFYAPPPYPPAYVERVLSSSYWPDLESFARDYVAANPTRKRSLDLLPLFAHHFPELRPAGKVRPRPAFHYRLPNAHVGRPGWTVDADWQRWLEVERLAARIRGG